ncbi:unnamed protein product [Amaranthus hypochondriacus]
MLQHPHVYTLGTGSSEEFLNFNMKDPPYDVIRTEYGGDVTYHGPRQVIPVSYYSNYFIFDCNWLCTVSSTFEMTTWIFIVMDGVDKEKVQRIVYEISKGSKYFENEERKEAIMRQRTDNMHENLGKLSITDIAHYQKTAERRITELEATRDLSRIWLHVNMDAFYVAVETLSNPSLKGNAMAVCGMSMISTANYEARRYGVRAAMPGFIARKLCPELIFIPVDFEKYTYYNTLTRKVGANKLVFCN